MHKFALSLSCTFCLCFRLARPAQTHSVLLAHAAFPFSYSMPPALMLAADTFPLPGPSFTHSISHLLLPARSGPLLQTHLGHIFPPPLTDSMHIIHSLECPALCSALAHLLSYAPFLAHSYLHFLTLKHFPFLFLKTPDSSTPHLSPLTMTLLALHPSPLFPFAPFAPSLLVTPFAHLPPRNCVSLTNAHSLLLCQDPTPLPVSV